MGNSCSWFYLFLYIKVFVYGLGLIGAINQNLLTETGALGLLGVLARSHGMAICCRFDTEKEIAPKTEKWRCRLRRRNETYLGLRRNIPLGMECSRIQDSFVTALQSGLWLLLLFFFFVPGSCLFMLISNFSFAFHLFLCLILVLFFACFWFTVWFLVLSLTLTFNNFCYNNGSWRHHSCTA